MKDKSRNEAFNFVRGVACSAELTHGFSDTGSGIAVAGVAQHAVHLGAEVGNVDLFFTVRGVHGHHNLSAPSAARRRALLSRSVRVGMIVVLKAGGVRTAQISSECSCQACRRWTTVSR